MSAYREGADATYLKTTSAPRYSLPYEWGQNLASGLATQSVAVVASQTKAPRTYTVYYEGSGSVVMSGAASGTCVAGTPSHIRPTGTSLTLTVTGSVTKLQVRELLGILSEEARTNVLLPFSSTTNVTTSTTTGVTGVSNSATLITVTAGNAAHRINFTGYTWTASVYTFSAVLTYTNHRYWQVVIWDGTTASYANVDLLTGTVGTTSGITATLEPVGVNSYRLIGVTTTLAAAAGDVTFDAISSLTDAAHQAWTATGTETVIAELFQMEVGSFATSPIPTFTATVTRAADVIGLATSKFNRGTTDYSLFADFILKRATGLGCIAYYNTSTSSNAFGLINANGTGASAGDRIVGTSYDGTSTAINAGLADTSNRRAVVVRSTTDIAGAYNGGTVVTGTTRNPSPTYLRIGGRENGLQLNGYVRGVLALPIRLADATMQEMTT